MMKNYFNFDLTGKKLLPIWLLFYAFFITPYVFLIISLQNLQLGTPPLYIFPMFLVLILIAFILIFYISKLIIENISYKGKSIVFGGSFGEFIGQMILGYFLSLITFGIYMPWFIRNMYSFFVDNSSYDSNAFTFKGEGGKLFKIITFTLIFPMIIMTILLVKFAMNNLGQQMPVYITFIQQIIMFAILIPYMYFFHKWTVNINFKNYNISWDTNFWNSCGKIAQEIFLSIITFGIYMPMATLKLYKYFTEKTVADNGEIKREFGFDADNMNDFLFIWGQLLLTIITLGIYYPWSICNTYKRLISKTYLK